MRAKGKKALIPPLGLMLLAALFPEDWTPRLVDCNVRSLTEDDWEWADMVMISAMLVQREGMQAAAAEAKRRGKTVVVGGPYVTSAPEEALAAGCDFVVCGEGEKTMPSLIAALARGDSGGVIVAEGGVSMDEIPAPRLDLIKVRDYDAMPVQTSRGCPFACEFCDVINLFGRTPRYKPVSRVLAELEAIFASGFRGALFFTDDNFIGNPARAEELLRALIPWNKERGEPFGFITQASINLGEKIVLIDLMTEANFSQVFIGIESPDVDVLAMAQKHQNTRHPLLDSIRFIQANGLTVIGSFILGLDGERNGAGERIEAFVEAANLSPVMINVLQAIPGTKLWDRLQAEGRLKPGAVGDLASGSMNFIPTRQARDIMREQLAAWKRLYDPSRFMSRTMRHALEMRPTRQAAQNRANQSAPRPLPAKASAASAFGDLLLLATLVWRLGVWSRHRAQFWRQLLLLSRKNPSRLRRYLSLLGMGQDISAFTAIIEERAAPVLKAQREADANSKATALA